MSYRISIYRTVARYGSIIETELITELFSSIYPYNLQKLVEQYEGDFAAIEFDLEPTNEENFEYEKGLI